MPDEITITVHKGDLDAIETAFWVCSEIATGGAVQRRDYVSALGALAAIKYRIEQAAIANANL